MSKHFVSQDYDGATDCPTTTALRETAAEPATTLMKSRRRIASPKPEDDDRLPHSSGAVVHHSKSSGWNVAMGQKRTFGAWNRCPLLPQKMG